MHKEWLVTQYWCRFICRTFADTSKLLGTNPRKAAAGFLAMFVAFGIFWWFFGIEQAVGKLIWFLLTLAGSVIVFIAFFLGVVFRTPAILEAEVKTTSDTQRSTIDGLKADFDKIVSPSEKQQFEQSVIVFRAEAEPKLRGNESDPQLLFHFWIFNGSLFSIYVKGVNGHVKFTDMDIAGDAKLLSDSAVIPRGGSYRLTIRQWISREWAQKIPQMMKAGANAEFSFGSVSVSLARHDAGLENVERTLVLPTLTASNRKEWEIKRD